MKKYSKDNRVVFNQENHSYFLGDKKLISVTTILSKFKNEFDSDYWSKKIAERENTTQEIILKKWKDKAFKSTEIGTAIHKIFEDYVNNNYSVLNERLVFQFNELNPEFYLEFNQKKDVVLRFINDFFVSKRLKPLESEFIVYNDFLAGQIDMICKDSNNNFYILDFKTNEKIEGNSYGKKMKGIFNDLNDCSFYHYCIQLSIYKKILKEYEINKMFLVHITTERYNFIECFDAMENINVIDLLK